MANRIKDIRKKRKLTQLQLALRIDSSTQQIHRLETGRADLSHAWLTRLAAALGCEPWELLDPDAGGLYQQERSLRQAMPNRIRELRLRSGLSQESLAAAVGCGHQQIYKLETGRVDLSHRWMKRLAPPLGCEPWELLDGSGGGLSNDERALLAWCRSLPASERDAFYANFAREDRPNILALYEGLTEADRQIVDWFLFEQHRSSK